MNRTDDLRGKRGALMLVVALCQLPIAASAEEPAIVVKTITYKVVGDTPIQADVYRPDDQVVRPVLVWIHGGALIMGGRQGPPRNLRDLCRQEGAVLVSIDYRLAPETKLPAIIEDVKDAFKWIRGKGKDEFHMDTQKLVVAGGSAGGYLTMMTGFCVEPRPKALVAYWGYGDIIGDWYTKPSEHYRTTAPLVTEEQARKSVGEKAIANSDGPQYKDRRLYYLYLRQNGLWSREVGGFDPQTERDKFKPYCPIQNLSPEYPPILMIHGTIDTDVPYDLSADMAKALAERKLPHELITVEGAGHGLSPGDKQLAADAHARGLEFIKRHLK